ncbi:hypothetical protein P0W64_09415 [Tsukamurella sp. 8F]|uniref:hypothetical protein n=1 Tax=unclassified Tsukamurella TaxID=2633480 RepID=UPI0023B93377|nr:MULTISPECIES: hypothetical protein [unclassified Tsukamurella]MDF0529797.1 hypothetical protein [Tsukamurella sp. 8J]MDF0586989.1 hypothetical protein [Tsukamurella sp. 8F]
MISRLQRLEQWRAGRYDLRRAKYQKILPGWHNRRVRRRLVAVTLALNVATWASAVASYFTLWAMIGVVAFMLLTLLGMSLVKIANEDVTDAPRAALDEFELRERDAARSVGFFVFWVGGFVPYLVLVTLAPIDGPYRGAVAYLGAYLVLSALMLGAITPILLSAWAREDAPETDPYLEGEAG